MHDTSSAASESALIKAMGEMDAAKADLREKKMEFERALHAMNQATETYRRAVQAFNAACQSR